MDVRSLLIALVLSTLALSGTSHAQDDDVAQQGFAISPVPKAQLTNTANVVGRGSYLVNAIGGCSGCHTFPAYLPKGDLAGSNSAAGDPFLGTPPQSASFGPLMANYNVSHYLAGGQCFGPFMARNLTPEADVPAQFQGKPEGLTEAEFVKVMRTGADIHCDAQHEPSDPICALGPPTPLLQVMPWPTFHNMTDADLKAIYAYLTAIPPATACNTVANGCPGFSGTAQSSVSYVFPSTNSCPNPPPPQ
jgi:hypothetical protein